MTLAALARSWLAEPLPGGVIDEARELATYGDAFSPWAAPSAGDVALRSGSGRWTYGELVPAARAAAEAAGLRREPRVMTSAGPQDAVGRWLAPWVTDGSLVLVRPDPEPADRAAAVEHRAGTEHVTHRL